MDAFDQIKKHLIAAETELDKKPGDLYLTGFRWGLTMALQIVDIGRWLEWHRQQIEAEELGGESCTTS